MKSDYTDENLASSSLALNPRNRPPIKRSCCKRVSRILFSHIGLVSMVVVYSVLGGFLFEILEQHNEKSNCEEGHGNESVTIVQLTSKLTSYIQFNITSTNDTASGQDNETVAVQKITDWLLDYRDNVLALESVFSYTGQDCESVKWNFPTSLLFAVTAITTIGYGTPVAPKTWEGQVVCICYAAIGIPIFLMCIANLSGVLGDMFRFIYSQVCCRLCYRAQKKKASRINFTNNTTSEIVTDKDGKDFDGKITSIKTSETFNNDLNNILVQDDFDDGEERVSVPLTVSMLIMTVYLGLGALTFSEFEGWGFITSAYFCFVTVATIGFGDYVPGQKQNDPLAALKLIIAALYILFGISILGMCFDLMQEEIITKITWVGKKLGLFEDKDDDEFNVDFDTEIVNKPKPKQRTIEHGTQFHSSHHL